MASTTASRRPSVAARRAGYAIAMGINAALLYLINVRPGWDVVPFLSHDAVRVTGWVNASIGAGIIANALYLVTDHRWFRALGDTVVTVVGLTAMVRLWQVFPFTFDDDGVPWRTVVRWLLALAVVGSVVAVVVNVVTFVRSVGGPDGD